MRSALRHPISIGSRRRCAAPRASLDRIGVNGCLKGEPRESGLRVIPSSVAALPQHLDHFLGQLNRKAPSTPSPQGITATPPPHIGFLRSGCAPLRSALAPRRSYRAPRRPPLGDLRLDGIPEVVRKITAPERTSQPRPPNKPVRQFLLRGGLPLER